MSWTTILVPHDFSASAAHAAEVARREALTHGARLVLLHVIELPASLKPDPVMITDADGGPISVMDQARTQALAQLQPIAERLAEGGVRVSLEVRAGHPVDEILRFIEEHRIDLIAMGTHGHTGIRRLIAGSVTEAVLRSATVPLLAVRHPG